MNPFTQKIRGEILSRLPTTVCCRRSLLCGLLINAECGIDGSVYIRLTGKENTETVCRLLSDVYGMEPRPEYSVCYGRTAAEFVVVSEKLSGLLSSLSEAENISAPPSFFRCEDCSRAFVSGLLLSSASFSDPEKENRVELRIPDPARASKLCAFFQSLGMFPGLSVRKGTTCLLFKRGEDTADLLTMSGAGLAAMDLIQYGLMRELRKDLQRRSNCEVSNLASAVKASSRQVRHLETMREEGLFPLLDDELRETAELRLSHPEASLSELCGLFDPPISKSGLSHRFERIERIYENNRKN